MAGGNFLQPLSVKAQPARKMCTSSACGSDIAFTDY